VTQQQTNTLEVVLSQNHTRYDDVEEKGEEKIQTPFFILNSYLLAEETK
jgi:hypothetical protein